MVVCSHATFSHKLIRPRQDNKDVKLHVTSITKWCSAQPSHKSSTYEIWRPIVAGWMARALIFMSSVHLCTWVCSCWCLFARKREGDQPYNAKLLFGPLHDIVKRAYSVSLRTRFWSLPVQRWLAIKFEGTPSHGHAVVRRGVHRATGWRYSSRRWTTTEINQCQPRY